MNPTLKDTSQRTQPKKPKEAMRLKLTFSSFLILLIVLFPLIWMTLASFKADSELYQRPPTWLPDEWTVQNYFNLFVTTDFARYFINTLAVAVSAVVVGLVVSLLGVYSVSRYQFVGQRSFSFGMLFIYMLPPILLAMPIFAVWHRAGWTNSLMGLMFTYLLMTLPFQLWILKPYIEQVPRDLEEAAMVDGCTRFQAFRKVVVPQVYPGMVAATVFTFVIVWNEYLYALVLLRDPDKSTISLGIARLLLEGSVTSWGMINAAGVVVTIPILILFILLSRRMVEGMTSGAVK